MRRWAAGLLVVVAACSSSSSSTAIHLPKGFTAAPSEPGETASFRRQYRAGVGATEVVVQRIEPPPDVDSPGLVAVVLRFDRRADGAELVRKLASDVPIGGATSVRISGHDGWVRRADATFASAVLVVDGRRAVLVYGGRAAEERLVAARVVEDWDA